MMNRVMKDSGVEWVGQIPEEWKIYKIAQVFKQHKLKNEGLIEQNLLSLSYGNVVRRDLNSNEGLLPKNFEGYNIIEENDIVLRMTDLQNDQKSLRVGLNKERGIITSAYITIRSSSAVNSRYGYYYLHAFDLSKGFYGMGAGVRQGVNFNELKKLDFIYPSLGEQQKIATFLDEKVSHIDNIIEDTKKSIENLKVYKQSLITETVTKGLDPNIEMKDSGIEWIGKIPKYWKVEKTKYSYKFNKGLSITKADLIDEGIPVINYGEIHSKYGVKFNPEKHIVKKVNPDYKRYNNALLKYGDVIFADTSEDIEGSGNFTTFLGETNCFAGYHTVVLKPIKRNNYIFMTYLFDSLTYRRQVRNMVQGIKVFSITQSILKNTYVWLPPIKEQNEIAIYLENKIPTLDKMISEKEKIIEELKDYKKSLIYEYVTGKKEVK